MQLLAPGPVIKVVPKRDSCVFRPPVDQPFVVEVRCETLGRMKRVVHAMERPEEFCNVGVQRRIRDFGACLPQLHGANESWMLVHDEQTLPKAKRVFLPECVHELLHVNGAAHANERGVDEDGGAVLRHKHSKNANKNLQETAR